MYPGGLKGMHTHGCQRIISGLNGEEEEENSEFSNLRICQRGSKEGGMR